MKKRRKHTLDLAPSDVHVPSAASVTPPATPAFAQPEPPKREDVAPVPQWPLSASSPPQPTDMPKGVQVPQPRGPRWSENQSRADAKARRYPGPETPPKYAGHRTAAPPPDGPTREQLVTATRGFARDLIAANNRVHN